MVYSSQERNEWLKEKKPLLTHIDIYLKSFSVLFTEAYLVWLEPNVEFSRQEPLGNPGQSYL